MSQGHVILYAREKGKSSTRFRRRCWYRHTESHPHTQLQKPQCNGAHKAPLTGPEPPHFGTRHQHKSILLAYVQNGLKSLSLIAKPPLKPQASHTDRGPVLHRTQDSHVLVLCPSTAWEDGCLQRLLDFLGCLIHKTAPQDLSTCPSFISKWTPAISEKPRQAHLPIFQLPQALKQEQYYFPRTYF